MTKISKTANPARANRLAKEKSPYLLQHQYNPVDWHAWGEEAFAKAREENKPIFLSIGYSTCHWCHVMERESFEDQAVAEFLNQHFVSIKVDREERPDVDRIYMAFIQATVGQGGWPLNVFLAPDRKPFFGGTYFPPDDRHGRPAFLQVLRQIQDVWQSRGAEIVESAARMHKKLSEAAGRSPTGLGIPGLEALRAAGSILMRAYDAENGGFGTAPKFPQPSQPRFLLRYGSRFGVNDAIHSVLYTCDRMAAGGIHDQLGGGFARYSVDARWLVPHFEKMLYDNAQLAQLFLDAFLVSGDARYGRVAEDIFDYVLRDMTHPQGGFYSAEDADSEGLEGKFYCWTTAELGSLLTTEENAVARRYFGITETGNFIDHSHPNPLPGQNVLSVVDPELSESDRLLLTSAKEKMFAARSERIRPHLDDKVLALWNGLMLGALARGFAVLRDEKLLAAARRNARFLEQHLWEQNSRTLYHRWREGDHDAVQLLSGYAFLLDGLTELYEATLEPHWLEFAVELGESLIEKFFDPENGGFWQSALGAEDLIMRVKEDYDGAEPSGNSVATLALLKLGKITGREDFVSAAEKTLRFFGLRLEEMSHALPYLLQALDFYQQEPKRVVIGGPVGEAQGKGFLHAAHSVYQPNKVVLGTEGPVESFAQSLADWEPAVYICTGSACQAPTVDPKTIERLLRT